MRIIFAGTPPFAATALAALIDAAPERGWTLPLVLSQPDRPAGRGLKLTASAVKQLALAHGLAVHTPSSLSLSRGGHEADQAHEAIRAAQPDIWVVAAYGLILPQVVLDMPQGCVAADGTRVTALNIHASLLPRWRGAAPVARAIEAGDPRTGITIMKMEAGLDTGPALLTETMPIGPQDTSATLTERLAHCGARLIVDALDRIGQLVPQPQPSEGVTYAHKITKPEAMLDFNMSAHVLARKVRALNPFPGASAVVQGGAIKIWSAKALDETASAPAGTIVRADADGVWVACGQSSVLCMTELQRPGARRMPAGAFLAGCALTVGERFERVVPIS